MGLAQIRVVLMGPLYGGNIGSVCRAMGNMGLRELHIVTPAPSVDWSEARKMACHAQHILDSRIIHHDLPSALADCVMVVGTSARHGLYRQHAGTARDTAPTILQKSDVGPVAYLFGREDNGLSNEELALCQHIVQIPTHTDTPSLNLSQAVLLCCYELFLLGGDYEPPVEKSPLADTQLRERMFAIWYELLLDIGFMKEDKAPHMMQGLRRLLGRGAISKDDVQIMMGVARQMRWATKNNALTNKDDTLS